MSKSQSLSGGTLSISSGTFSLGGVFNKNGGNLFLNDTTLSLLSDLQWSSDTLLEIKELQLNDKTLNLVDQFSDLKIISPLTLDHSDEKLISGPADLEFSGLVIISAGELSSNGGVVIFDQGLNQSGGKVEIFNSSLLFGLETEGSVSLIQTGGEILADSTSLQLQNDMTLQSEAGMTFSSLDLQTNASLTSDSKISIDSLDLNQSSLTLGTAATELEIQGLLQLDDPNQKLITGGANLDL